MFYWQLWQWQWLWLWLLLQLRIYSYIFLKSRLVVITKLPNPSKCIFSSCESAMYLMFIDLMILKIPSITRQTYKKSFRQMIIQIFTHMCTMGQNVQSSLKKIILLYFYLLQQECQKCYIMSMLLLTITNTVKTFRQRSCNRMAGSFSSWLIHCDML